MFVEQMRGLRRRMLAAADQFRVDHGRQINPDGWPARLYLRAYADDRASWLGVPWSAQAEIYQRAAKQFPEVAAYVALEARRRKLYSEGGDWRRHSDDEREEFGRWCVAAEVMAKAVRDPWTKEQYVRWHAERCREIRGRFEAGRQSLCPFFWSVVIAVVFYLCLIPAKRFIGRSLRAVGRTIAWFFGSLFGEWSAAVGKGALASSVFAFFFLGTTYRVEVGDGLAKMTMGTYHTGAALVGWVTSRPSAWAEVCFRWEHERFLEARAEWAHHLNMTEEKIWQAERAEAERRHRERFDQAKRELHEWQLAWDRDHPEEAARRRADYARRQRESKARWALERADSDFRWKMRDIQGRIQSLEAVPRIAAWCLVSALAIATCVLLLLVIALTADAWMNAIGTAIAFVLTLCFIGLERFAIGKAILAALNFLLRLPGIILRGIGAFLGGCVEGLALVFAFGLAVVRGACPMLIPVRKSGSAEPTA